MARLPHFFGLFFEFLYITGLYSDDSDAFGNQFSTTPNVCVTITWSHLCGIHDFWVVCDLDTQYRVKITGLI